MTDAQPGSVAPRLAAARPTQSTLLLCLSHLRWNFVFQRPQHLLTRAAQTYDVILLEEPIFQAGVSPHLDLNRTPEGVTVAVPMLPEGLSAAAVVATQRAMLDELLAPEAGRPLIAWYYTPMALEFSAHLRPDLTVYDCMDELSAFRGAPPRMMELEQALLNRAGLVFTGGRSLYEAKRNRHARVSCFPSSIDTAHFAAARSGHAEPADIVELPRPRIGFFGVVDERMDPALVGELAALRPDWSFVMIGPVVKINPADLPRLPNIHWIGGRDYKELPAYLGAWDAGFMPFARNESTRFISPTKTPEFLAAGLPVVSTPITDVVRDWGALPDGTPGLVEIAEDAAGFARALDMMLERPRGPWLKQVDRRLSQISWDRTWSEMRGQMETALRSATRPVRTRTAAEMLKRAAAGD